jgi:hypothetical protein
LNEETLFHLAKEKPLGEWPAFLEEASVGRPELRRRVEVLLRADDAPGSLLARPTADAETLGRRPGEDHRSFPQLSQPSR